MLDNFLAGLLVFIIAFFVIFFATAAIWGFVFLTMMIVSVIPPFMLIASLVSAFIVMIVYFILEVV